MRYTFTQPSLTYRTYSYRTRFPSIRLSLKSLATANLFILLILPIADVFAQASLDGYSEGEPRNVVVSPNDDRLYRYLTLKNGMKVLLISDPSSDKAAASLDVFVGSGDDPKGREGLAHFLEHMLFLGTKKYPKPEAYQEYIKQHGGTHNAYTSLEHTNYIFEVDSAYLEPTLDRFSQFFIAPLFNQEYVDRERKAVHSEYSAKLKDEYRRAYDVFRQVFNPSHPSAKFSVGNLTTLADRPDSTVREDLLTFYDHFYSADQMALVVIGKESLDALQAMVEPRFNQVRQANVLLERMSQPLFSPGDLPLSVYVQPEKEQRTLTLAFPVENPQPHFKAKPLNYIGNVLGHEGPGSIIDVLKTQGWADSLSAGGGAQDRDNGLFQITIRLTQEGYAHTDEIVGLVFAGIEQLRKKGLQRWRFNEQKEIAHIEFDYQEKGNTFWTASNLASRLHEFPVEEINRGPYLYDTYDEGLLVKYLSKMTPKNLWLTITAPEVKTDKITELYTTPYSVKRLVKSQWSVKPELKSRLALYEPNPFIPGNLALVPDPEPQPVPSLIVDKPHQHVWHRLGTDFGAPKGSISIRVDTPTSGTSALNAVKTALMADLVVDKLQAYSYPAQLAGLRYALNSQQRGFDVHLSGFTEKQGKLLDMVLKALTTAKFEQTSFDRVKERLRQRWKNAVKQAPYKQLYYAIPSTLTNVSWPNAQKLAALETVTLASLNQFASGVFKGSVSHILVNGNFSSEQAYQLAEKIETITPKLTVANLRPVADASGEETVEITPAVPEGSVNIPPVNVIELPQGNIWQSVAVDHPDKALVWYVQGADDSLEEQARVMLLEQMLSSRFFHELRTEQQLGYIVYTNSMMLKNVPAITFVVQSPSATVEQVQKSMMAFANKVVVSKGKEFEQHKKSLVGELLESPKNLREQSSKYWADILAGRVSFDRREQLARMVEGISAEAFAAYVNRVLLQQPRSLWLSAGATGEEAPKALWLNDVQSFKLGRKGYRYP
ncbi:insulinase family protein [Marinibactrum halimedae]|uniref:insulinase family protein n=1 Tax=Marinibactrum halimedae TaxID=1444977 RepID=UPI001E464CCC|nr:insulinase family protein [Marinibactrum halimedae]MCD9457981.1 insulinase family protein [Marinibactrum halimedae]